MSDQLFVCGTGVFVSNVAGGMDVRPAWRASVDALCAAVARTTGFGAQVRYQAYPAAELVPPGVPRTVGLDISGPSGCVSMSISISSRGNPCVLDRRDLPSLGLGELKPGAELEFWMANEADTFPLPERLVAAVELQRGLA
jgi:hypothetical protein